MDLASTITGCVTTWRAEIRAILVNAAAEMPTRPRPSQHRDRPSVLRGRGAGNPRRCRVATPGDHYQLRQLGRAPTRRPSDALADRTLRSASRADRPNAHFSFKVPHIRQPALSTPRTTSSCSRPTLEGLRRDSCLREGQFAMHHQGQDDHAESKQANRCGAPRLALFVLALRGFDHGRRRTSGGSASRRSARRSCISAGCQTG